MLGLQPLTWFFILDALVTVPALASIWLSRLHGGKAKAVWTALVTVLPIVGSIAWFALGREPRRIP